MVTDRILLLIACALGLVYFLSALALCLWLIWHSYIRPQQGVPPPPGIINASQFVLATGGAFFNIFPCLDPYGINQLFPQYVVVVTCAFGQICVFLGAVLVIHVTLQSWSIASTFDGDPSGPAAPLYSTLASLIVWVPAVIVVATYFGRWITTELVFYGGVSYAAFLVADMLHLACLSLSVIVWCVFLVPIAGSRLLKALRKQGRESRKVYWVRYVSIACGLTLGILVVPEALGCVSDVQAGKNRPSWLHPSTIDNHYDCDVASDRNAPGLDPVVALGTNAVLWPFLSFVINATANAMSCMVIWREIKHHIQRHTSSMADKGANRQLLGGGRDPAHGAV